MRSRTTVYDVAALLSDDCVQATALLAVHAGSSMALFEHGVELRVDAACDHIRRSRVDEVPC